MGSMNNMSWVEIVYWGSTVIGGTLFFLRTIMMLVGGGLGQEDFDADFDANVDADHTGTVADSDFSFQLLSMQGLTAFFMMFGLVGLALLKANLAVLFSITGGVFAGLFAVWVISWLFSQMKRLQSDGTLNVQNAVGVSGSVYLNITESGTGQMQVTVQGALKIFDAVSTDKQMLKTGEKILVIGTVDNNTLIVEKI
jgi:hypothetical protein